MSETGQQRPTSRPRAGGPDARRPGPPSPQGSPQGEPRQSATRFAMLLALARGAVAWENIWPAVWQLLGVLGAFLAVAPSGLLPALHGWLHSAVLVAFAGAFVAALGLRADRKGGGWGRGGAT